MLGLHMGPNISAHAAAALADLDLPYARRILYELTEAHLLEHSASHNYQFHDLLRVYANEQVCGEESEGDRRAAVRRLLEWYLHAGVTLKRQLGNSAAQLRPDPPVPRNPIAFVSSARARSWLEVEIPNLVAVTRQASEMHFEEFAWKIPDSGLSSPYVPPSERVGVYRIGLEAARRVADRNGEGRMLLNLGESLDRVDRISESIECLRSCLAISLETGDREQEAWALNNLGADHIQLGKLAEAVDYACRALVIWCDLGYPRPQGVSLGNLGKAYMGLGRIDDCCECLDRAERIFDEVGDRWRLAWIWLERANIMRVQGNSVEALVLYGQALDVNREMGDRVYEAHCLRGMGQVMFNSGDIPGAQNCWRQALVIYSDIWLPGVADVNDDLRRTCAEDG